MDAASEVPGMGDAAERQARLDLAACYRLAAHFGLDDIVYTHISLRVPGTDHFLLNPFGTLFSEITASSLIRIDADGRVVAGEGRVNEAGFVIHSALHMAREDAHCVMHAHTRAGMAVSALRDGLLPVCQKSMIFYGRLGYHDYEGLAFNMAERDRLIADLGPHRAMVLRNHGLLTCGRDCAEAFSLMYQLDLACRAQVDALAMGVPLHLPPPEVCAHTAEQLWSYPVGPHVLEWPALLRLLDRTYPDWRG
ncbi:class II aldolase/adducin family protein [Roseomonas sp. BN140053]|uniref:class II aldolase/adducin family protein n=1 Tax=Roseomonas sp. BN140053 TaxID=3391898 RepID=UPI0039ED21C6